MHSASEARNTALSLLDVLTGLKEVKVCTGYRLGGQELKSFDTAAMAKAEPIYQVLPAWQENISKYKTYEELPAQAKDYVSALEEVLGRPVGFISVGPERMQTITHHTQIEGLA